MKKAIDFLKNRHGLIFKVFLFIVSVGLIVFIFPGKGKFKYEFQKGKPWPHEDLIAPFNFAVQKTTGEIAAEKQAIKQDHKPYFFKNQNIQKQAVNEFENNLDASWEELHLDTAKQLQDKSYYKHWGINFLHNLFEKGIIELHASIEDMPQNGIVLVLTGNISEAVELKDLYTIKQAYRHLKTAVSDFNPLEQKLLLLSIEDLLEQNLSYDEETNKLMLKEELEEVSPTKGMVQKGERVIAKGELVNDRRFQLVESLKIEYESKTGAANKSSLITLGQIVLVSLMILALCMYLLSLRKDIIRSDTKIIFLLSLIVLFVYAAKTALSIDNISIYLVPFCMIPLLIRTFFDTRLALFTYLVAILIIGFIAPNPYEFIIIQMIAGIITLFSILNLRNRAQLFLSSFLVFVIYSSVYLSIGLVQEGAFQLSDWMFLWWFFGSAMLTLFTYPLVYVFEKVFGFVSNVSLMELADTNSKLLRKLNMKAPGTFQHSLQVSNLADEAIRAIGGNSLLVRTGALYHDIGKMYNPNYFIENQNSDYNPHDELTPKESAHIIIEHVIKGIEIARRYKLPDIIIDFIRTHHGTSLTLYFYRNYKNENPEDHVNEDDFRYPGPIPYSKETAVLMMADSVEAASRSLPSYDRHSIEKLVDGIIDRQIEEEQFVMADITFKDITTIKKILKKKLMSIYHVRVEYPEDKN